MNVSEHNSSVSHCQNSATDENSLRMTNQVKIMPQWCGICKIALNAPQQLEQHFAGWD
jgi:hypothetical protein